MVSIFESENYRKFLAQRLTEMPNKGYGQMSRLARFLGVHSTLVSQILKEHKSLTTDQAALVAEFFGLVELEAEYFVILVRRERAGNPVARKLCQKQLERLREQAQNISKRVSFQTKLTEEQRAVFYSDWMYSAIRQFIALPKSNNVDAIAIGLDLPRKKVQEVVEFLIQGGLCKLVKGELQIGSASTHVEASSPWVRVHHSNWRQRALHSMDRPRPGDIHYTVPLTLSRNDSVAIGEKIIQFIAQINSVVDPSPSEALYCLNVDWFCEGK